MVEFINILLHGLFDSSFSLMTLEAIKQYLTSNALADSAWTALFYPPLIVSLIVYIGTFIGLWQLCIIFPFRLLKRFINYPKRTR